MSYLFDHLLFVRMNLKHTHQSYFLRALLLGFAFQEYVNIMNLFLSTSLVVLPFMDCLCVSLIVLFVIDIVLVYTIFRFSEAFCVFAEIIGGAHSLTISLLLLLLLFVFAHRSHTHAHSVSLKCF